MDPNHNLRIILKKQSLKHRANIPIQPNNKNITRQTNDSKLLLKIIPTHTTTNQRKITLLFQIRIPTSNTINNILNMITSTTNKIRNLLNHRQSDIHTNIKSNHTRIQSRRILNKTHRRRPRKLTESYASTQPHPLYSSQAGVKVKGELIAG